MQSRRNGWSGTWSQYMLFLGEETWAFQVKRPFVKNPLTSEGIVKICAPLWNVWMGGVTHCQFIVVVVYLQVLGV